MDPVADEQLAKFVVENNRRSHPSQPSRKDAKQVHVDLLTDRQTLLSILLTFKLPTLWSVISIERAQCTKRRDSSRLQQMWITQRSQAVRAERMHLRLSLHVRAY